MPPPDRERPQRKLLDDEPAAATLSYHTFGAGFSLAVYALFYIACDIWGWQLGVFRTLGTNALVGYILHGIVGDAVEAFVPKDRPLCTSRPASCVYFGIIYLFIRHLEKNKIYLKL